MTKITDSALQKIEVLFIPEDRDTARRLIEEQCGTNLPLTNHMGTEPEGFDRIRFAVLKLSKGNIKDLEYWIEQATIDWRDVLMAAGFGENIHAHLKWNPKR